jgi:hypothetical protein
VLTAVRAATLPCSEKDADFSGKSSALPALNPYPDQANESSY